MGDHLGRAEEFEKKAEKKLNGQGIFGSKYEDAADLLEKAANSYKLAICSRTANMILLMPILKLLNGTRKLTLMVCCKAAIFFKLACQ